MTTYLSVITMNVNGRNAPNQRHTVDKWKENKIHIHAAWQRPTAAQNWHNLKVGMEKRHFMEMEMKKKKGWGINSYIKYKTKTLKQKL